MTLGIKGPNCSHIEHDDTNMESRERKRTKRRTKRRHGYGEAEEENSFTGSQEQQTPRTSEQEKEEEWGKLGGHSAGDGEQEEDGGCGYGYGYGYGSIQEDEDRIYGEQGSYEEKEEDGGYDEQKPCWKLHYRKRPRKRNKPLVELSDYESFFVSPSQKPFRIVLPCEILDSEEEAAATAFAESLQLSVTEYSQATAAGGREAVDLRPPISQHDVGFGLGHGDGYGHGQGEGHGDGHALGHKDGHGLASCWQKLMDSKVRIMAARLRYGTDIWSLAAQIVNPYEALPCVAVRVLNRAFFKMWELMQTFPALVIPVAKKPRFLSAHLCEGPGGFIQAVLTRRLQGVEGGNCSRVGSPSSVIDYESGRSHRKEFGDAWFAITLATSGKWDDALKMQTTKLQESTNESVEGHIHYGADQSGDITNPNNISSFVQYVLQKSSGEKMHLITGDGAFDVSDDFSLQEQSHSHLLFCEMVMALRLQCPGGSFVLKLFDCFTETTATVIYILASLYTTVEIVRLRTSRVCNSERFLVAQGFRGLPLSLEHKLMNISVAWYQSVKKGSSATISSSRPLPPSVLNALSNGNAAIANEQVMFILRAVAVAQDLGERLSITSTAQHKGIVSILRRKLKTMPKLQTNACSLCRVLSIPLADSWA